jgi:hypothetical protein
VCTTRLATVIVGVDDQGIRCLALGHLVDVVGRRQPGPDVEELPDPHLGGQEPDAAGEEGPVRAHRVDDVRVGLQGLLAKLPVRREVVLAAQLVIILSASNHTCRRLASLTSDPTGGSGFLRITVENTN